MKTIPLTQGKTALVDDEDYERVSQFKWFAHRVGHTWYAKRNLPSRTQQLLHRFLMPGEFELDHADGNGLNNCRHNLRFATRGQNLANRRKFRGTSQFKGVYRHRQKWSARVGHNRVYLGIFADEIEAAKAYDRAARDLFGKFARLNFPNEV